jgi:hypothetical protein
MMRTLSAVTTDCFIRLLEIAKTAVSISMT